MVKTVQIPVFLLGSGQQKSKYRDFCYQRKKNVVNTLVLGFRSRKAIGIYSVFCSEGLKNMRNTQPI